MKLKGRNARRLKPKDKKKKEETLKRMEEIRKKDSAYLRDVIKAKLVWAENQRLEGLKQIEKLKIHVNRLEGIVLFIKDILNPQETKNEKK